MKPSTIQIPIELDMGAPPTAVLEAGDTLIVVVPIDTTPQQAGQLKESLAAKIGRDVVVLAADAAVVVKGQGADRIDELEAGIGRVRTDSEEFARRALGDNECSSCKLVRALGDDE